MKISRVHVDDVLEDDFKGKKIKIKVLPAALTFLK